MKKVSVVGDFAEDPNCEVITGFMRQEFPEFQGDHSDSILEGVMKEMIGSRQVRQAEGPTPESQVVMREVVRKCIGMGHPIPILVVSGPKKTVVNESIDVAELSALKMLACLNRRVKAYFPPGIVVRIRLEDSTGYYLEDGVVGLRESINRYMDDFCALIRVLGYDFITPIREHTVMSEEMLKKTAGEFQPLFEAYLAQSEVLEESEWGNLVSWEKLVEAGWQGQIPREMRRHYNARYYHLFPGSTPAQRMVMTARYFAGTLARHRIKGSCSDESWPGFFQLSFAPPTPGIPISLVSTRLYYRTVPFKHTKRHIPFWRAKGILKLDDGVRISLASWSEKLDLIPFALSFTDGKETVSVQADYVIDED